MPGLPREALEALQAAAESFADKPIAGAYIRRFDLIDCRSALGKAKREGKDGQIPMAIYEPKAKHTDALVVVRVADFAQLLDAVERAAMLRAQPGEEEA